MLRKDRSLRALRCNRQQGNGKEEVLWVLFWAVVQTDVAKVLLPSMLFLDGVEGTVLLADVRL